MVSQYAVRSLSVGTFEEPGPAVFWMRRWDEWISLRLQLLLIEGHGRTILVNTALPDDLGPLRAEYPGAIMWGEPGTRGAHHRDAATLLAGADELRQAATGRQSRTAEHRTNVDELRREALTGESEGVEDE